MFSSCNFQTPTLRFVSAIHQQTTARNTAKLNNFWLMLTEVWNFHTSQFTLLILLEHVKYNINTNDYTQF